MELMNAVLPSDDEYLKMSVFALVKNRIPWLCVLMISGTLSAFVIGMYQSLLDSVVMLSSFMTIITGTAVTPVRRPLPWLFVVWRWGIFRCVIRLRLCSRSCASVSSVV